MMPKPFNKIRLSYLEDMINDPEVMNSIRKDPESLRNQWIEVASPKGRSDWPEEVQALAPNSGIFKIPSFAMIHMDGSLHFFDSMGGFDYARVGMTFFYNKEFNYIAYIDSDFRVSINPKTLDRILVVTLLNLKKEIGTQPAKLDPGEIKVIYEYWLDGVFDA